MGKQKSDGTLVQGTLDMLILKTLGREAMHGYGIAQSIQQISDEVLRVEEGSLYPSLHRLSCPPSSRSRTSSNAMIVTA